MDEVDLLPPEFAQLLVAQSAVQIQNEGGIHVFAPQLRCVCEHTGLLVSTVDRARQSTLLHMARPDDCNPCSTRPVCGFRALPLSVLGRFWGDCGVHGWVNSGKDG